MQLIRQSNTKEEKLENKFAVRLKKIKRYLETVKELKAQGSSNTENCKNQIAVIDNYIMNDPVLKMEIDRRLSYFSNFQDSSDCIEFQQKMTRIIVRASQKANIEELEKFRQNSIEKNFNFIKEELTNKDKSILIPALEQIRNSKTLFELDDNKKELDNFIVDNDLNLLMNNFIYYILLWNISVMVIHNVTTDKEILNAKEAIEYISNPESYWTRAKDITDFLHNYMIVLNFLKNYAKLPEKYVAKYKSIFNKIESQFIQEENENKHETFFRYSATYKLSNDFLYTSVKEKLGDLELILIELELFYLSC